MTSQVLESTVLSKPYFEREGLIVATEDDQVIGFVHAGFGPDANGARLDTSIGATSMLRVCRVSVHITASSPPKAQ